MEIEQNGTVFLWKRVVNPRDHYSELANRCRGCNDQRGVSAVSGKKRRDSKQRRDGTTFQEKIRELKE